MVMSSGEADSAYNLAGQAARELREIDKNHELLKYFYLPADGEQDPFDSEEDRKKQMKDRFWGRADPWKEKPGVVVVAVVFGNYYLALQKALQEAKRE